MPEWVRPSRPTAIRRAPFAAGNRGIGPPEGVGIGLGERVADDSADVIFAEDGGVECVCHSRCLTQAASGLVQPLGSGDLLLFLSAGDAEPGDHLAQFLAGGDWRDSDFAELRRSSRVRPLGNSSR